MTVPGTLARFDLIVNIQYMPSNASLVALLLVKAKPNVNLSEVVIKLLQLVLGVNCMCS